MRKNLQDTDFSTELWRLESRMNETHSCSCGDDCPVVGGVVYSAEGNWIALYFATLSVHGEDKRSILRITFPDMCPEDPNSWIDHMCLLLRMCEGHLES